MLLKVDQRTNYSDNKEMSDSQVNQSDEDEEEAPSDSGESNRLWSIKPSTLSGLRQLLAFKMKKNPKHKPPMNPMGNFIRKLTCGSNTETSMTVTSVKPRTTNKSMAYRRCLRIRPSHARHLSTTHTPLGQVFAPELLQRNSSPTSGSSEEQEEENCSDETSAQCVLPSGEERHEPRSSFWAFRLYNSFRRPKKEKIKPAVHKPELLTNQLTSSPTGVQLLELPARHQPLLHRYGVSQFVLLVDWNDAECRNSNFAVTANHPLRSVMRKPQVKQTRSKKSVKFQDSISLHSNSSTSV